MLIDTLARLWRVNDTLPEHVDVIAIVSFAASRRGLTKGSRAALDRAIELKRRYLRATVIFGTFAYNPDPDNEEREKKLLFPDALSVGPVASTIGEAERIRQLLPRGYSPRSIIVVTDEWHSRSVRLVWRKVWSSAHPQPDIRITTISSPRNDLENPMLAMRTVYLWALANVLRHLFLVLVPGGFAIMKKLNIHQPTG